MLSSHNRLQAQKGASAGLRAALAALLIFYGLGYGVLYSIFWAALAGVAMGHIAYWLALKDEPEPTAIIEQDSLQDAARDRRRQGKIYARHYRSRRRNPITFFNLDRLDFWRR